MDSHLVVCVSVSASMVEGGRTHDFGEQGCGTLALSVGVLGQVVAVGIGSGCGGVSPHIPFQRFGRMGKHQKKVWPDTPCWCRQRRHLKVSFTMLEALRLMLLDHPWRIFSRPGRGGGRLWWSSPSSLHRVITLLLFEALSEL
jgi:hypothetical protein